MDIYIYMYLYLYFLLRRLFEALPFAYLIGPHPGHNGFSASRVITHTQSHLKGCVYLQALDVVPPRPKGDARSFKSCLQGYYCVTDQQGMANSWTRNDPEQRDTPTAVAHIHLLLHMLAGPVPQCSFLSVE